MKKRDRYFFGKVDHGQLVFDDPSAWYSHLKQHEQIRVRVTLGKVPKLRSSRTTEQIRYYWGVVLAVIADYTGHSVEELHEVFKAMFLKPKDVMGVNVYPSTTDLDTGQMTDYIENIRNFASRDLACYVPDANEFVIQ